MSVPTKRHRVQAPINPNIFHWTGQRKRAVLLIAEGKTRHAAIAIDVGVHYSTYWDWRQHPIFQAELSRLTLANEKATREGLLRLAFRAIEDKIGNIADDRSTVLEWAKFIADLQGYMKQKVELDANLNHSGYISPRLMTEDELQKVIEDDLRKLLAADT